MNESHGLEVYKKGLSGVIHFKGFSLVPYLFLAVFVVFMALFQRNKFALVLMVSGLLYWVPLFFIGPSNDFRYNSWLIFAILLSFICVVFNPQLKKLK